jgi:hypothetical protein
MDKLISGDKAASSQGELVVLLKNAVESEDGVRMWSEASPFCFALEATEDIRGVSIGRPADMLS